MSLTERIDHLETLVFRMIEEKERVVQLSRWEVGNSFQDSEKEFDRTMEVIDETLTALRNLDLISSRFFAIERGIIGRIRRAPMGVALWIGPLNYPLIETFYTLIPAKRHPNENGRGALPTGADSNLLHGTKTATGW